MKKLLACLLVWMLLWSIPLCACAESASSTAVMFETDPERLAPIAKALTGKENMNLAKGLAELLNGIRLEYSWQDGASEAALTLNGEDVVRGTVIQEADVQTVLLNFAPGYALKIPSAPSVDTLVRMAQAVDWTKIREEAAWSWDAFLSSADYVEEHGDFIGDAYAGGVRRQVLRLDDRDLSLLLSCLMNVLEHDSQIQQLPESAGADLNSIIQTCDASLKNAALINAYSYQVCAVYDDTDRLIGLSGTALQGEKQIATISIGLDDQQVEVVWGYGYHGVNYYIRTIVMVETEDEQIVLSGLVDVLADTAGVGYGVISALEDAWLEEHVMTLSLTNDADVIGFDGGMRTTFHGAEPIQITVITSGEHAQDGINMTAALYWESNEEPALVMNALSAACDPIEVDPSACTAVDLETMSTEEALELERVIEETIMELGISIFKQIPPELMFLFMP